MREENLQDLGETHIGEMLSQILNQVEATSMRFDSLEELFVNIDAKVDALAEDVSALRSQMDLLASELHQVRTKHRIPQITPLPDARERPPRTMIFFIFPSCLRNTLSTFSLTA